MNSYDGNKYFANDKNIEQHIKPFEHNKLKNLPGKMYNDLKTKNLQSIYITFYFHF